MNDCHFSFANKKFYNRQVKEEVDVNADLHASILLTVIINYQPLR